MSGSSDRGALVALIVLPIVLTGAALAAPVAVLETGGGGRTLELPLDDGATFRYAYQQSIYEVTVTEELVRTPRGISIERVRSSDIRAVEYFRWDGRIRQADGGYVQDAPANGVGQLLIRVTPSGRQRLSAADWSVGLLETFGDAVVRVRPEHVPFAAVLRR